MSTWFRRAQEAVTPPPEPDTDSPAALSRALEDVVRLVNSSAGRLPVAAVVAARRITDAVHALIATAEHDALDVYTTLSVKGIVGDYLPTTLRAYLALDPDSVERRRPDGRTASESLLEQLDALWVGASDVLRAARSRDADALMSQGNFLHAKFTGSDLDL